MIYVKLVLSILAMLLFSGALIIFTLAGCTISFQNISTHGTATDLVDENQAASPTVSVPVNVSGLPGLGVPVIPTVPVK